MVAKIECPWCDKMHRVVDSKWVRHMRPVTIHDDRHGSRMLCEGSEAQYIGQPVPDALIASVAEYEGTTVLDMKDRYQGGMCTLCGQPALPCAERHAKGRSCV